MSSKKIAIAAPCLGEEERRAVLEPLETGWLTQGPKVAAFETAFARRHGVRHAVATTSCTTALHLALAAAGIGPEDEVIVPAFTWVATANVVLQLGARPVFVDVDERTYNLDVSQLESAIGPRTRAVLAVHLFGLCADVDAIRDIACDVPIIEDAACAAGASYHGRAAGSLGLVGAFSFHPRKTITTGEGGMLTTNDNALAERLRRLRNHGASVPEEVRHRGPRPHDLPDFPEPGYNYRMTDLQGALGLAQLEKLDRFLSERREAASFLDAGLADLDWLETPQVPDGLDHAYQAYVCRVREDRAPLSCAAIMDALQARGISTRPGTHAVPPLSCYRDRPGVDPDDFPVAGRLERETLALPLHNNLVRADYERVVRELHSLG